MQRLRSTGRRPRLPQCIILSDSQAAIAAVKKAGRTRRAITADLRRVKTDIKERQIRFEVPVPRGSRWIGRYFHIFESRPN